MSVFITPREQTSSPKQENSGKLSNLCTGYGIFALSLPTAAYRHALRVEIKTVEATHLDTNLVSLLVSLLKDEVNHLSDLIGSHGAG